MPLFQGHRLVSGQQGLSRVVRIANITETPEVAQWMTGGEFLFTCGYIFKDSPHAVQKLFYDLSEKGVAALGLRTGKYLAKASEEMIHYSDEIGLPLIELPDIPFIQLAMPIFEKVINNQYSVLKKTAVIHNQLLSLVLAGKGLNGLIQVFSSLINYPLLVIDERGNLLAEAGFSHQPDEAVQIISSFLIRRQQISFAHFNKAQELVNGEQRLYAVPLEANHALGGYLLVAQNSFPLDEQELVLLDDASTIFALEITKLNAKFEAEKQVRGELLDYLLSGNQINSDVVIHWAKDLNFDLTKRSLIFYAATEAGQDPDWEPFKSRIHYAAHHHIFEYPGCVLTMIKNNCLIGLVNIEEDPPFKLLFDLLQRLLTEVNHSHQYIPGQISIGVGRAVDHIEDVRTSYQDAKTALRIGNILHGADKPHFFEELGSYAMLYHLRGFDQGRDFVDMVLGPLLKYDQGKKGQLFYTLTEYFNHNCNIRKTAEGIFVHRNSLLYRLQQIEKLTGKDLSSCMDRFDLLLSVRLLQISYEDMLLPIRLNS